MAKSQPPAGYRVSKVNIQDPRYGSPNYRHVAKSPSGEVVSRGKGHFTHEAAVQSAHDHLSAQQFGGTGTHTSMWSSTAYFPPGAATKAHPDYRGN